MRAALALFAGGIGYVSVVYSLAEAIKSQNPARAHAMAPGNGRIDALLAEKRFVEQQEPQAQEETRRLALSALSHDPTAVQAVTTLGFQAQLRGDAAAARRLLAYSQRLSRRDLQTQVWAIEDAVSRSDVPVALNHYDIALRTAKAAPDLLFPILSGALAEPGVRMRLAKILTGKPAWGPNFITYVAGNSTDPRTTASFFAELKRVGVVLPSDAVAGAVNGLLASNLFDAAWQFYESVRPGVDRRQSRDWRFAADLATPSAFDWTPVNDATVSTSIQRNGHAGLFEFSTPPSTGGALLAQTQVLPPGEYRLDGHSIGIAQPDGSAPYWVLTCHDGHELGRIEVPNSVQASGAFAGRFGVPADCPVQTLTLVARPSDAISGNSGQIDRLRLLPVS